MRHFMFIAGALVVPLLSTVTARAQERSELSLTTPVAAPSNALELKVGTGYTQGFGMVAPNRSLPNVGGAGIGVGLDVDYRINPSWSVGVEGQYQELQNEQNSSARGLAGNVGATYHFLPAQSGDPFVRLGTGYRLLWENDPLGASNVTLLRHGFELASLKVGYDFRASEDIAFAPVVGADLNTFLFESGTNIANRSLPTAQVGTFIYAGVQGRFDMGGTRTGGRVVTPAPEPEFTTAAEVPAPAPPPPPAAVTQPVSPSIAVTADILRECELKLDAIGQAPKFEFDRSELLPADLEVLSQIATCFTTGPMKGMNVQLVGRADPRGTVAYNDALGLKRAKAVETYLTQAGVDKTTIQTTSRGKRDAVGTDEASWAVDRRVDILSQ